MNLKYESELDAPGLKTLWEWTRARLCAESHESKHKIGN